MEKIDSQKELGKLGARIKQIRKHRKLTLLEFEMLSGINDSDLSRYEQGKENFEFLTLVKIANALEVQLVDLINYEGHLPSNDDYKGPGRIKSKAAVKIKRKKKN